MRTVSKRDRDRERERLRLRFHQSSVRLACAPAALTFIIQFAILSTFRGTWGGKPSLPLPSPKQAFLLSTPMPGQACRSKYLAELVHSTVLFTTSNYNSCKDAGCLGGWKPAEGGVWVCSCPWEDRDWIFVERFQLFSTRPVLPVLMVSVLFPGYPFQGNNYGPITVLSTCPQGQIRAKGSAPWST
jgi:hypothetical protein